jgi:pimeloyl-ACP methyl ester carboxylesterase
MMGYLASERVRPMTLKNNLILEGPLRSEMNKGTHPPDDEIKAAYRGPFPTVESRTPTWVLAHHLWTSAGESFLDMVHEDLAKLRDLPVLLLFGQKDRFTTSKDSLPRFQKAFPRHETVVIPDAGHFFPESSPEATTTALRNWLDLSRESRQR